MAVVVTRVEGMEMVVGIGGLDVVEGFGALGQRNENGLITKAK